MQRGERTSLQRDGHVLQQVAKVLVVTAYAAGLEGPRACPQQQLASSVLPFPIWNVSLCHSLSEGSTVPVLCEIAVLFYPGVERFLQKIL